MRVKVVVDWAEVLLLSLLQHEAYTREADDGFPFKVRYISRKVNFVSKETTEGEESFIPFHFSIHFIEPFSLSFFL